MTDVIERVKTYQQFIGGEWVDSASGETLVDERVAAAGGTDALIRRDPLALKGFGSQVAVFALASDAEARAVAGEPPS